MSENGEEKPLQPERTPEPEPTGNPESSDAIQEVQKAVTNWLKYPPTWAKSIMALLLAYSVIALFFWQVNPLDPLRALAAGAREMVHRHNEVQDRGYKDARAERSDMVAMLKEMLNEQRTRAEKSESNLRESLELARRTYDEVKQMRAELTMQSSEVEDIKRRLTTVESRLGIVNRQANEAINKARALEETMAKRHSSASEKR